MLLSLVSKRSLEVDSRDAYGFALRPQHVERYREYLSIYKEEEAEREEKWAGFLERQDGPAALCSSEEEFQDILQAEAPELREDASSDEDSGANDSRSKSLDSDNISKHGSSEELHDHAQGIPETGRELFIEREPAKDVQLQTDRQNLNEELPGRDSDCVKDDGLLEEPESEKERQLSAESASEEEKQLPQVSERVDQLQLRQENGTEKCVTEPEERECQQEKEGKKEAKASKIQGWAHIRPSLGSIEAMMCSRVKKAEYMKDRQSAHTGSRISSTSKSMPSIVESEENFGEHAPDSDTSTSTSHARKKENDAHESVSPGPFFPWYEELEVLVRLGVPKDLRGEVWQAFAGVKARRIERYYQDMLDRVTNSEEGEEHKSSALWKWKRQIEKDIPRTFPGHPALNEDGRDSLRRILLAYACHNPSVGYCQAMNFFAGLLLLLMPEENAFWTLVGFIDDYFDGYYTEEMIGSQVDQLVFEELIRERFPKLVNHLDYLGVQVAWISGPWFLSIFVNILPWESVLRLWDVLLFEGNRVMLFRTALALMELYGPAIVTTKDAGDAITLLQTLSGSTFDSSQLVLTACMGYLSVTEARLQDLRVKHRPEVLEVVEERTKRGRVWKDKKGLASKLYSFKHERSILDEDKSGSQHRSSDLDGTLDDANVDSEPDSIPDLQEQVVWMKVELCRLLEEKRSAVLRAEELETALMEMVKEDNRLQLCARIEQLEQEVGELRILLADKKEQESAMLQVLMKVEQEQKLTEDARISAEQDVAAQKYAVHIIQEKYDKAIDQLAQMEKRVVVAESTLQATLQYESGQNKALSSPRFGRAQHDSPKKKTGLLSFGFGWRNKGKQQEESNDDNSSNLASSPNSPPNESVSRHGSNSYRESNLSKESKAEDQSDHQTKSSSDNLVAG
ncbi:PREDICTED: TBC1 domain family member 2A isoform X2 [Tarenaya hassleriana]|uniref:TBC1 domain family member 2A isoform X2 n=1 Tax=Tarenaya hassleriana TaxID=28532 RepID=UPI00053C5390|nr:PREDICTED: TBC1 domain family member 2A isoform X2 [Tarenaya hassleriana]